MFRRLGTLFGRKPRAGDVVTVLDGPYAGRTGTVSAVHGMESAVYFDEWSEPRLPVQSLRVLRRGRPTEVGPPDAGTDVDYEEARARIRQIPPSGLV